MYLSVFYCLFYVKDVSKDFSEEHVSEERNKDLDEVEDIRMDVIRDKHWRDVAEEGENKKKIHSLRWDVYAKDKEKLIKRWFLLSVLHPKGGDIVWTCVKNHIIE